MSYERNKNTQVTGITEAVQLQLILQIGPGQVRAGENYFPIVRLQSPVFSCQFCSVLFLLPILFLLFLIAAVITSAEQFRAKLSKLSEERKMNFISFHLLRVKMNACLLL